jgi:hypothetical protein
VSPILSVFTAPALQAALPEQEQVLVLVQGPEPV